MRRRRHTHPVSTWAAAAGIVALGVVAIVVVVVVATQRSGTAPPTATSLRLDPSGKQPRAGRAAGGQMALGVDGGDYGTCALLTTKAVDCWGDNAYGQLGDGTKTGSTVPREVSLGRPAVDVSVGGSHACAALTTGTVSCWGSNAHGELGNGSTTDSPTPVPVPGVDRAVAVAAGVAHTCALLRDGSVMCWGANGNGQLGDGTTTDSNHPVQVTGLAHGVQAIAAGLAHTCALLDDGTVACWGSGANGELGNGANVDSPAPAPVTGLPGRAIAVAAGDAHTCAVLDGGAVRCWGWNIEGQLGNGGGSDSAAPVAVTGLPGPARAVTAGGSHTCALLRSGAVFCWGANLYGQLGNGTTSDSADPVAVSSLGRGVVAVSAGLYHACALLSGGSATCWGWNEQGQLGSGDTTSASEPVGVAKLGLAPDGTGELTAAPGSVAGTAKSATIAFTFTAAAGGMHDGSLTITVPLGWSLPSTTPRDPGYVTSTLGRASATGRAIAVNGLDLASGGRVTVVYGSTAGGGPGAQPRPGGGVVWRAREQSSPSGNLSTLRVSPIVRVLAPDGSGEVATRTTVVSSGATGRTLVFDFTAAPGGVDGATVTLTVPEGWPVPSSTGGAPGYTSASAGVIAVSGRTVSVNGVTLPGGGKLRIAYGERTRGGPGAQAPSSAVGAQSWDFGLRASTAGTVRPLTASPQVVVLAPNGSGSFAVSQSSVANGAHGVSLTFTYQADAGGMKAGAVSLTVPRGWSPPSRDLHRPGYVTASEGKPTIDGRTIILSVKQLGSGGTVAITYGGAVAPSTNVGAQPWPAAQRSTPRGTSKALAALPEITVLSADGSGTLARATGPADGGSKGNTVAFVYTAEPGGMDTGVVTIRVPDGWDAPSAHGSDAGFTTASTGSLSVSGHTITVSNVTLGSGGTLTVIYGSRAAGGPGAQAPKRPGPRVWQASEQSTPSGTLKPLRR